MMSVERKLGGKVVLITGASSGIGAATAILFYKLGANVSLVGRNGDNLSKTAAFCEAQSGQLQPHQIIADLGKEADVKRVMDSTMNTFGRLDILVNCAGIVETGTIESTSLDQYDRIMNINVRSVYHLTMLAVPHLALTKGCIVNVSSVNGVRSFPGVLAYCVSKSALDQFTKCIALELAPKHIRVNSVNPGVIETSIHRRGGMDQEAYEQFLERAKTTHALGRHGQPEEVAQSIAFLASDDASFITGTTLLIDGGRHLICPR